MQEDQDKLNGKEKSLADENSTTKNNELEEFLEKETQEQGEVYHTISLNGMYESWFLDYASYVILERAVPDIDDGLKPVQRRILHSMKELDDGRYNKVANIIGNTMKYHPHGDASIGDALVQLGQKDLLIDAQGNWGNVLTGDRAAAPRYIEARLSKFALEVLFNPKTTDWKKSYDGRNNEPSTLPVKFPLLLAQGVEGIAVGLASKILPHNFNELIDACILHLNNEEFVIYPDFLTGGLVDVSKYNDGLRGGKIRVRAKINKVDKRTLSITEIPFGTTTSTLIDSIIAANDRNKIKIKKVDDNTAANVEIIIQLAPGVSPDQMIDALYAFTNCEMSISPNSCIINSDAPAFVGVSEILRHSTDHTVDLLRKELEIRKGELLEQLLFSSLEKIFIENRIYHQIEECETWEDVLKTIDKGLEPYKPQFYRDINEDDLVRLTEIKIKRISKFNAFKADEIMRQHTEELKEVEYHMAHIIQYTIDYFEHIKKKYGKDHPRKAEIRNFDNIEATSVVVNNAKLYVDREEGFAGTGIKKAEFVCDCSDIDDIIVIHNDGTYKVLKVADKAYVGKDILHIDVFKKNDDRTIYNVGYKDGKNGAVYVKRFFVKGVTRDKEYDLTKGTEGSKIIYFTVNPNGEAEVIKVYLRPKPRLKKLSFEFNFSDLTIKNRNAQGNMLTKNQIRKILKKEEGVSTLGAIKVYYDDTVRRINMEERGKLLGSFKGDDKILSVLKSGHYMLYNYDPSTHFEDDMFIIQKHDPEQVFTVIYYHGEKENYYIKRFNFDITDRKMEFIPEHKNTRLILFSEDQYPRVELEFDNGDRKKPLENEILELESFIDVKGIKAMGNRLSLNPITSINQLESLPDDEPEEEIEEAEEINEEKDSPIDDTDQITLEF
ncbi:MAG: DNA gyrase/topoisomerase IV subunit A [Bacteroidales bacterium]|nr:DNA gyrase/topoisomerase IV subunit A [Bacteroidales bacterium]